MSKNLAPSGALELLDGFKATVQELSVRAEKINEVFLSTQTRERRRYEAALEEEKKQLTATQTQVEASFEEAKAKSQSDYAKRKTWIGKAYQASREQRLKSIDQKVGGCRYELQKKMLQAEKDRDKAIATLTEATQELKQTLAGHLGSLSQLEREAQRVFSGYKRFQRWFFKSYEAADVNVSSDEHKLVDDLQAELNQAQAQLTRFRGLVLLRVLKYFPVWFVLVLCAAAAGLIYFRMQALPQPQIIEIGIGGVVLIALRFVAQSQASALARSISRGLARARRLHDAAQEKTDAHYREQFERIQTDFSEATKAADQQLKNAQSQAANERVACRMKSDERTLNVTAKHEALVRARRARIQKEYEHAVQEWKQKSEQKLRALTETWENRQRQLESERESGLRAVQEEWLRRLTPLYQRVELENSEASKLFPSWEDPKWNNWVAPAAFAGSAKLGELKVKVEQLCDRLPKNKELALPGSEQFSLPLCLVYPREGSVLFETSQSGHDQAIGALNNILFRLLSTAPPGRFNFTIIDPVGLGQNFAGVMHLADYEEQLINNRIWTQSSQIDQKLADLNEHMEKVIQMYLRNEYQTIAEYNEQAGVIAEKYYFLAVADFPAGFSDTAVKRLLSIAASGARCGVFTLIHWDRRQPTPQDFIPDDLRKSSFSITWQGKEVLVNGRQRPGVELLLDEPPAPERATELVHQIGKLSRDSSRVEVPFEQVAPAESELWSEETTSELRVPIGRTGATKLQYLAIGKGTRQHGLIAGKTGSGKSTLFHVVITNLALWCSPEQVEFYLVDFKKGVEFKCYASKRLPHARVVAIESDREFGLSVLQRVDDELKRRGDLFRQLGVQDIAGYRRAGGSQPIPRTLLLIDEFQEFFVEDDRISQTASLLLDRIVRQGRAFGIHVLLGSQTLGGAYTVARTTLGQMVIRIALQCNEADAYLIMDENNPAPRLLSRPGEGIYNDMAGALEGNSPFQVVWLPEQVRDNQLLKIRAHADQDGQDYPGPIVFEGNAPADISENPLLRRLLEAREIKSTTVGRIWLGAPNSIKGPTEATFQRQSGNNLLIVGQRDEAVLGMFTIGLISLASQFRPGGARFIVCDATPPDTPAREYLQTVIGLLPHPIQVGRPGDLPDIMKSLASEMKQRAEETNTDAAAPVFLFIHGIQRFGKLRFEDDFSFASAEADAEVNPAVVLNDLICEGARLGLHVIAACDTYNNVNRYLSRKALSEFEMRVVFQMSANDSASLIDNPKAGMLGLHRALFYNAQEGYLETFRPYALPSQDWLEQAGRNLVRLLGKDELTASKLG